jgi:hypothetical protein
VTEEVLREEARSVERINRPDEVREGVWDRLQLR